MNKQAFKLADAVDGEIGEETKECPYCAEKLKLKRKFAVIAKGNYNSFIASIKISFESPVLNFSPAKFFMNLILLNPTPLRYDFISLVVCG